MNIAITFSNISLLCYVAASILYVTTLRPAAPTPDSSQHSQMTPSKTAPHGVTAWWLNVINQPWITTLAFIILTLATISVTIALAAYLGEIPLLDLSGLMLTAMISWMAIHGHLQFGLRLVGPFVAPLATLILLVQFLFAPLKSGAHVEAIPTYLGIGHILSSIVGQAFAIMACAISILYLWQQSLLKKKKLDQIPRSIPAIDQLSRYLVLSLWAGFLFITLGLVTGALYFQRLEKIPTDGDYILKVAWAIFVWLWYLATLVALNILHRPHKKIAQMALGGFALLAISYFGMGILRPLGGG
jgi:ABC-type uncharacterized transport system permease subunit